MVADLEEKERKLVEIEDWAALEGKSITDWRKKPSKLRADAAKAEIASMTALKDVIGEKRALLLTGFPQGEHSLAVAEQLDTLETLVCYN